jgi:hypothetical protein
MVEGRGCLRFALEPLERQRRRGDTVRKDFDRDDSFETRIRRSIHFSHAAGVDQRDDFIRTETRADWQGHE